MLPALPVASPARRCWRQRRFQGWQCRRRLGNLILDDGAAPLANGRWTVVVFVVDRGLPRQFLERLHIPRPLPPIDPLVLPPRLEPVVSPRLLPFLIPSVLLPPVVQIRPVLLVPLEVALDRPHCLHASVLLGRSWWRRRRRRWRRNNELFLFDAAPMLPLLLLLDPSEPRIAQRAARSGTVIGIIVFLDDPPLRRGRRNVFLAAVAANAVVVIFVRVPTRIHCGSAFGIIAGRGGIEGIAIIITIIIIARSRVVAHELVLPGNGRVPDSRILKPVNHGIDVLSMMS
mmetsp:Transcript_20864/g.50202  ORF Transcript_20864/g.50202 Transcript_20864/m.50202 type:complete len:287 (-) Transcript_20864:405-1265(-)